MIVKALGIIDIAAAIIIASADLAFLGVFKWLIVGILLIKGVPSLFG